MRVTLYVPCYNVETYISTCLEGVLKQTHPPDEILVIDDGSRDRTVQIASQYPVKILRHQQNSGLAAARNTAFRNARHELVAALDADCIAEPSWLERLVNHFSDEKLAGVNGRLEEAVQTSLADRWRKLHMAQHWGDAPVRNPRFLFGADTVYRKAAVLAAGGYDERLRTNGEDSSMSTRVAALGYHTFYDPRAVVRHLRQDTVRTVLETYWRYRRDYFSAMTASKFWHSFRYQHIGSARYELQQDWRERHFDLLWVDALMFFYLPYCDLRLLRASTTAPQSRIQSSEV
jgi:glycosyltransferase involved in cell wall biosynthesis